MPHAGGHSATWLNSSESSCAFGPDASFLGVNPLPTSYSHDPDPSSVYLLAWLGFLGVNPLPTSYSHDPDPSSVYPLASSSAGT